MNKFHQIATDTFFPVSHDNSYLFNHYEKIANFLAFNLENNYKNILAKPVQNGYAFDWFSVYENLENINDKNEIESKNGLIKYWVFLEIINKKITHLANSSDEDSKNWAQLLTKVFNHKDNFIFSNGNDISIVWGWQFDNHKNYKPNLVDQSLHEVNLVEKPFDLINPENTIPIKENENLKRDEEIVKEVKRDENRDSIYLDEEAEKIEGSPEYVEGSFLKFLKWFASKFWWLLWLLLLIIIFLLLFKSCDNNDNYVDVNNKLNQLEQKANNCAN